MSTPFISIIGSGNVAWHLAPALDNAGFVVKEIYSRNPAHAEALTDRLYQAEVKATLDFSTSVSKIFIITTKDDAIQDVVQEIILPDDAILIHTSGTQPMSVLDYAATAQRGVFYPLQTFSKSRKLDFRNIPLFIEGNDDDVIDLLTRMGKAIGSQVNEIDADERKAIHVAAVFASNFTNHMLTIASGILKEKNLDFQYLAPLIAETISKSLTLGPENAQTGPAKRGDLRILDEHLEYLKSDAVIATIYRIVSQHIVDVYNEE